MTKILVVEDNEQLAEMLVERLERRGHVVLLAADGQAAFASAKAAGPEVILFDSELRGDNPWNVAHGLKTDDHTREIPIIALMGENSAEAQGLARNAGAETLHLKPIDFGRLLQEIDAAIRPPAVDEAEARS